MNPRWAAIAPWCREIALPASVLAVLVALGFASGGTNKVAPIVNRVAPSLTADVKFADRPPHVAADKSQIATAADLEFVKAANTLVAIAAADSRPVAAEPPAMAADTNSSELPAKPFVLASADPTASIAPATEAANEPAPSAHEAEPKPIVTASLGDPAETISPATTPEQTSEASTGEAATAGKQIVGTAEILDECYVIDACADRYLWALYERTR